ncbi:hypothetical protein BASA81_012403 [Batrachochytrium salamandrivorans]|nr:hypothetical protein BASA81_012403 [Batrachochytrium salamandrivorans]
MSWEEEGEEVSYEACEEQARVEYGAALKTMQQRDFSKAQSQFALLHDKFHSLLPPTSPFKRRLFRALLKNRARCHQELGQFPQALGDLVQATSYLQDEGEDLSLWLMLRREAKRNAHTSLFLLADSVLGERTEPPRECAVVAQVDPPPVLHHCFAVSCWRELVDGLRSVKLHETVHFEWKPPITANAITATAADAAMEENGSGDPSLANSNSSAAAHLLPTPRKPTRARRHPTAAAALGGGENGAGDAALNESLLEDLLPETDPAVWQAMHAWFSTHSAQRESFTQQVAEIKFKPIKSALLLGLFVDKEEVERLCDLVKQLNDRLTVSQATKRCIDYLAVHYAQVPVAALASMYSLCVDRGIDMAVGFEWVSALAALTVLPNNDGLELLVLKLALEHGQSHPILAAWTFKRNEERGYFLRNFALVHLSLQALVQVGGEKAYALQALEELTKATSQDRSLWELDSLLPHSAKFAKEPKQCIRQGLELCAQYEEGGGVDQFLFKTALHLINTKQNELLDWLFALAPRYYSSTAVSTLDDTAAEYFVCRLLATHSRHCDRLPPALFPVVSRVLPCYWVWCAETRTPPADWLARRTSPQPVVQGGGDNEDDKLVCMLVAMKQTKAYGCLMRVVQQDKLEVCKVLLALDDSLARDMLAMLMHDAEQQQDGDEEEEADREQLMCACAQYFIPPERPFEDGDLAMWDRFCAAQFWCRHGKSGLKLGEKRALAEKLAMSPALLRKPWLHLVHMNIRRSEHGDLQFLKNTEDFGQLEGWLKQNEPQGFLCLFLQLKLNFMLRKDTADLLPQVLRLEALREDSRNRDDLRVQVGTMVKLDNKMAVVAYVSQDGEYCDVVFQRASSTTLTTTQMIKRHVPLRLLGEHLGQHGDTIFLVADDYDVMQEFDEYACVIRHLKMSEDYGDRLIECRDRYPNNWQFAWLLGKYDDALRILRLRTPSMKAKEAAFEYETNVAASDILCRQIPPDYHEAIKLNPSNLNAALHLNSDSVLDLALRHHFNTNKRLHTSWFVWEQVEGRNLQGLVDRCALARFDFVKQSASPIAMVELFDFCHTKQLRKIVQEIKKHLCVVMLPTLGLNETYEMYKLLESLRGKGPAIKRKFEARLLELGKSQLGVEDVDLSRVLEHCRTVTAESSTATPLQQRASKLYKSTPAAES